MISRWTYAIAMTVALTLPATAAPAKIERIISPGGLEAWLVSDDTLPVVSIEFAFRGGGNQDPADKPGVARLISGLLDEGAGDLDAQAFQTRLHDSGAEMSFEAGADAFYGRMRTLSAKQDEAFELLRMAVTEPRFDEDAIERIRAQILSDLIGDSTEPHSIAQRAFFETAYPGHPYGRLTKGTPQSVAAITRDDIAEFAKKNFARDNLVIVAVGAIDATVLGTALDRIFGGLPEMAQLEPVTPVTMMGLGETKVIPLATPQTMLVFGRPGVLRDDPDFMPMFVLNHILGEGSFTSRLFREVREKRGLTYGIYTQIIPYEHTGLLIGSLSTRNDRAAEALEVIRTEIDRIIAEPPTEEELTKAKKYLTGSYPLRFDSSTRIARQLLGIRLEDMGIDYVERRNALIEAVTREDLARAAKRLLDDGGLLVVAVGQPEGLDSAQAPATESKDAPTKN